METEYRGIRIFSTFLMIFGFVVVILRGVQIGFAIGIHQVLCMPVQGCIDTEIGFFYVLLSVMLPGLLFAGGLGLRQGKSRGWWSLAIYASFQVFYHVIDSIIVFVTRGALVDNLLLLYAFLCLLLLIYLFREKVLAYASIQGNKRRNLLILL